MKKCQFCDNPATVHLTDIIQKKKREMHLCDDCAREHNLIPVTQQELNVPALLQFLMNQAQSEKGRHDSGQAVCPECGMKYAQFRAQGRLGCPADYDVFRAALEPLLERIHRRLRHVGKAPTRHRALRREVELQDLRQQLENAVRHERFEEAAHLRDLIRTMGTVE
jgi:protein arginine kinase activator